MMENLPELDASEIDEIVKKFKNIYQPALQLVSARIRTCADKANRIIISEWNQRNLERGSHVKILRYFLTDLNYSSCVELDSADISHWILNASSKCGKFKAVFSSSPNEETGEEIKLFLEIWSEGSIFATFDLTALDLHGDIYTDYKLISKCWSPEGDKFIYLAEQKKQKTSPFYHQTPEKEEASIRGEQYVYEENWGEAIQKSQPVIVCCDILKKSINILEGVPEDISPGQVVFEPNGDGVVGVGFINTPRRLGLMYCSNKKSHVFHLSETGKYIILSDPEASVDFPQFSPNGKHLIWLQRPQSGPMQRTYAIMKCNWVTKEIMTLVDVIRDCVFTQNGKPFYGIYHRAGCGCFVERCWTHDSKYLIFSTDQQYCAKTFAVKIDDGKIWDISCENSDLSTILLDVNEDGFGLFNLTSFKQPHTLATSYIALSDNSHPPTNLFTAFTPLTGSLSQNLRNSIVYFSVACTDGNCLATYYGPKGGPPESVAVVMFLHGGPHNIVPNGFTPEFDLLIETGFAILVVNFRGSIGSGEDYLMSLVGKMGSLDVADCYTALQVALRKFPWLDPNKVVLFGASSAGFTAGHLIGKYPKSFKAVALRNPINDVYLRCFLTDVPDWATEELGFAYEGLCGVVDNEALINKMTETSPLRIIKNVITPTLLCLGKKDVRVPASLGLVYYRMLKELNVPTKVLYYDDNHRLLNVPVEMDFIINTVIWFHRCFKMK